MPLWKNSNTYRREVVARLKKLAGFGPMIDGSLVVIRRRCGNPACRCAKGEKHPAYYITRKLRGKTQGLYIPVDMVQEVREWNQEHRRLKGLVAEICERQRALVRLFGAEKRRKGPRGKR
jgi:hypothetical protein